MFARGGGGEDARSSGSGAAEGVAGRRTPTIATIATTPKRDKTLMAAYVASNVVRTPGVEENDAGRGGRRRSHAAVATPESAGVFGRGRATLVGTTTETTETTTMRVGAGKRAAPSGGFDSPEREDAVRADDDHDRVARAASYDASERTPPASPTRRATVCPQTPIKARRTRVACFDDDDDPSTGRPRRGRVARSLLEEFEAAERSLEDMVERSDTTTLSRNLRDDPFDDPF